MSQDDDGKKTEGVAKVYDLTARLISKDVVTDLSLRIMHVMMDTEATPVQHLTALALVSRAFRELLAADGASKEELDELIQEAFKALENYQVRFGR